ncbi:HAD-IIA family hydrolase [Streptomyces sp. 5-8]|uniref:HAD-IIA family hydrolase n=1 Tax=Streptomyces musisoli TaxID=2802280 RepID=A0ABS1NXG6_9ACTN|nr:HAD-IIA family hydrolase [Streptomyces musisoli]
MARLYDAVLLDLDGVVRVGSRAVPYAVPVLGRIRDAGCRTAYVTNNAGRATADVAGDLRRLGLAVADGDVVTSAQAAARLAAERCGPGARVLVVGSEALRLAVAAHGLRPVASERDKPAAVVQGFAPAVSWRELAEAGYAVARGVPWIVTNTDPTAPTQRGVAPGNGALVAVVRTATGTEPVVAGKPAAAVFREAAERAGARRPLMVGDSLDTDVQGARRAGFDSLLVLTGRTGPADLLTAPPHRRPTHVGRDLRALCAPPLAAGRQADGSWRCRGWHARVEDGELLLAGHGDLGAGLWAACTAAWSVPTPPDPARALAALARAAEL